MKIVLALLFAISALGQTVSISQEPGAVFVATFGAPLAKVAVYRAMVCSSPGVSVSGSWGSVEQIAEGAGISIVDNVLAGPSAQKAESKTTVHKAVTVVGYVAMATLFAAVFKAPSPWLIEGAATITGGATILDKSLSASEAQVQATISAAMAALMDPTAQFSISNGACLAGKLFLGSYVPNFTPIRAQLPSAAAVPAPPAATVPAQPTQAELQQEAPTSPSQIDGITVSLQDRV